MGYRGLQQFHRLFIGGAADVAGSDVVIIGKDARHLAIERNPRRPVHLPPLTVGTLLRSVQSCCHNRQGSEPRSRSRRPAPAKPQH